MKESNLYILSGYTTTPVQYIPFYVCFKRLWSCPYSSTVNIRTTSYWSTFCIFCCQFYVVPEAIDCAPDFVYFGYKRNSVQKSKRFYISHANNDHNIHGMSIYMKFINVLQPKTQPNSDANFVANFVFNTNIFCFSFT